MIKNLLGKKESDLRNEEENDPEIQNLRDKFNKIVNSDNPESNKSNIQDGSKQKSKNSNVEVIGQPEMQQKSGYEFIDPEKAEENERIINLIMQQIKELIEIDNNLNAKLKELETKIGENNSTLASTKSIVDQFNQRLELIEKNMEKFMGLYEVVTNRFNPFVSEEPMDVLNNENNSQTASDVIVEDVSKQKKEKPAIENEAKDIASSSPSFSKLDNEQQSIVLDELKKGISLMGPQSADNLKNEIVEHMTNSISKELKNAMEHHINLSNETLKNTMKELLLETLSHVKQTANKQTNSVSNSNKKINTDNIDKNNAVSNADKELHPDFHFNLPDGTPIKSIQGLKQALQTMDNKTFSYHVNEEKNDFAQWLRVVTKNENIANIVAKEKTPKGILNILNKL